jgi:hypothetical protein
MWTRQWVQTASPMACLLYPCGIVSKRCCAPLSDDLSDDSSDPIAVDCYQVDLATKALLFVSIAFLVFFDINIGSAPAGVSILLCPRITCFYTMV